MNHNPPTPNSPRGDDAAEMNAAVMKLLKAHSWRGRVLTTLALCAGLLAIFVGIVLASFISKGLFPQVELMLRDSPAARPWNGWQTNSTAQTSTNALAQMDTNAIAINMNDGRTITSSDPEWRRAVVTLMLAKGMFLTSVSIALLGVGTFLTLLLVIFNRRVALRQISASLAQISNQLKELK